MENPNFETRNKNRIDTVDVYKITPKYNLLEISHK